MAWEIRGSHGLKAAWTLVSLGALVGCGQEPLNPRIRMSLTETEVLVGQCTSLGVERQRADAAAPVCVVVWIEDHGTFADGSVRMRYLWGGGVRSLSVCGRDLGTARVRAESYDSTACGATDGGGSGGDAMTRALESATPVSLDVVVERTTRIGDAAIEDVSQ